MPLMDIITKAPMITYHKRCSLHESNPQDGIAHILLYIHKFYSKRTADKK